MPPKKNQPVEMGESSVPSQNTRSNISGGIPYQSALPRSPPGKSRHVVEPEIEEDLMEETMEYTTGLPVSTRVEEREASEQNVTTRRARLDRPPSTTVTAPTPDITLMFQQMLEETRAISARVAQLEVRDSRVSSRASQRAEPPVIVPARTIPLRTPAPIVSGDARNYETTNPSRRFPPQATLHTPFRSAASASARPRLDAYAPDPVRVFDRDISQLSNHERSHAPRLKPADIGYWDPHGTARDDDKNRPEKLSVNLFVRRLKRLAGKYGESQVVDNLESALVHCSAWLETFSSEDEGMLHRLDGWIHLLLRDYAEPEVLLREQAQSYDYGDASSATEFWTEKVSRLRRGGFVRDLDIYYEIWTSLPPSWKENIDMSGSLDYLRSDIRRREAARGRWPSKRRDSSDSGYESRGNNDRNFSNRKRGGATFVSNSRDDKRKKSSTNNDSIPSCRICASIGKFDQKHWHRECPNASAQREKVNQLLSILESEDDEEGTLSRPGEESRSAASESHPEESGGASSFSVNRVTLDSLVAVESSVDGPTSAREPMVVHKASYKGSLPLGSGEVFRRNGPAHAMFRPSPGSADYSLCVDSGCGPVIGNRSFVLRLYPNLNILQRSPARPLKVRGGFNGTDYETLSDYAILPLFFPTRCGNLLQLEVEVHLTDSSVDSNILLGMAGLRSNGMSCDFRRGSLEYRNSDAQTFVINLILGQPFQKISDVVVKAVSDLIIPAHHEGLVRVDLSHLPDRDYILDGSPIGSNKDIARTCNGVANSSVSRVIVGNFSEEVIHVKAGDVLGHVSDLSERDSCRSSLVDGMERSYFNSGPVFSKGSLESHNLEIDCISGEGVAARSLLVMDPLDSTEDNSPVELDVSALSAEQIEPVVSDNAARSVGEFPKETTQVDWTDDTPLSAFFDDYDHEEFDDEPSIGVSLEDIQVNPRYSAFCQQVSSVIPRADGYLEEKWKFSDRLTPSQIAKAKSLLESIPIWNGIGCLNTGETMPMPIKEEYRNTKSIQNSYPMSKAKRDAYDLIAKELESQGVLEDSSSTDFCSPCLIVIQKNKPRFVIDFRRINEMTPVDIYPLPRQTDVFNALQNSNFISLFDFKKMFFQFPIDPKDRPKTTFKTRHAGAKQLTRSTMGYVNSPAYCQRQMDKLTAEYRWKFVIVYMDDICIYSSTWDDHMSHISVILKEIQRVGLTLDPSKAFVGFQSVNLLGHLVGRFGLAMQDSKIAAMMDLPEPHTIKDAMQCLGFFGYYRPFIRGFAQITEPITRVMSDLPSEKYNSRTEQSRNRMSQTIVWGPEQKTAFDRIKTALREATYLSHALDGPNTRFRLYIDACKIGFGAALHIVLPEATQVLSPDGHASITQSTSSDRDTLPNNDDLNFAISSKSRERPCAFISRNLKKAEKNFWPTELEMGGLVWALNSLEETIEGRNVEIFTDHSALIWLFNSTNSKTKNNQRLIVWTFALQKWKATATIKHRPGRSHVNADVLSRYPVDTDFPKELRRDLIPSTDGPPRADDVGAIHSVTSVHMSSDFRSKMIHGYSSDKHWSTIYRVLNQTSESEDASPTYHSYQLDKTSRLLYWVDPRDKSLKLCVPSDLVSEIFRLHHDDVGHPGYQKTWNRIVSQFHVDRLTDKLKSYIGSCSECAMSKNKDNLIGYLNPLSVPFAPCDCIAMDFVTGLPVHSTFDAILTITDKFSKMVTFIACCTSDTAEVTADRFIQKYYCRFGLPLTIVSDRDPRFIARFWKELFLRLNVTLAMSTAYAPQTDGQSERTNQTMEVMLRTYIGYDGARCWVDDLPFIEYNINSQTSVGTDKTPFEIMYGGNPRSVGALLSKGDPLHDPSISYRGSRLEMIRQEVFEKLSYSRAIMAAHYDRNRKPVNLSVGDMVYIESRPNFRIPGLQVSKTGPRRFGPFKILEPVGKGAYRLLLPDGYRIHDVISVRHLTKARPDEWNRIPERPPALVEEGAEDSYEVECVIDKRKNRKKIEYLCKWKGYPVWESSWIGEDQESTFRDAINDYESRRRQ